MSYWVNGRCELDGGIGAPYEERITGTAMVCENGHHWIAYRRAGTKEGGE